MKVADVPRCNAKPPTRVNIRGAFSWAPAGGATTGSPRKGCCAMYLRITQPVSLLPSRGSPQRYAPRILSPPNASKLLDFTGFFLVSALSERAREGELKTIMKPATGSSTCWTTGILVQRTTGHTFGNAWLMVTMRA